MTCNALSFTAEPRAWLVACKSAMQLLPIGGDVLVEGQCNCGAVAFAIDAAVSDIFICHCSICRKLTGSNGIAVVLANREDFYWLRGEDQIGHWKKPDADWESWFCRTCGTTLPGINDPSRMFVPAGLLASIGQKLRVAHHVWVGSKAPWDAIGDDGKQHANGYQT